MTDIQAWLDQGKTLMELISSGPWEFREIERYGRKVREIHVPFDYGDRGTHGPRTVIDDEHIEENNARFIADARTRLPQALNALQAILDLHRQGKIYGEPGDPGCGHNDDYDGPDHFWDEDYGMTLCESTATHPPDPFCAGCPRDEEWEPQPYPCPTVRAIHDALERQQ